MDRFDQNILRILMRNGNTSNSQLAKDIGLSESATLHRVRELEKDGVIEGYSIRVNPKQVDRGLEVFMTFTLKNQSPADTKRFEKSIQEWDEILNCAQLTGRFDYVAHIAVKDVEALQRLINEKFLSLGACINRMETLTVLKMVKRNHPPLPIPAKS